VFALAEHEFELFYLANEFLEKEMTMGNEASLTTERKQQFYALPKENVWADWSSTRSKM